MAFFSQCESLTASGGGAALSLVRGGNTAIFGGGVLTGAAVSSFLPWEMLGRLSPAVHIVALAAVCAACVLFRLALRNKTMRRVAGLFGVMAGGFLMASGQHFASATLTMTLVVAGATAFACGILLLFIDRQPSRAAREGVIQRLLEVENKAPGSVAEGNDNAAGPAEPSREDKERWAADVLAFAAALGVRPLAPYSDGRYQPEESKKNVA